MDPPQASHPRDNFDLEVALERYSCGCCTGRGCGDCVNCTEYIHNSMTCNPEHKCQWRLIYRLTTPPPHYTGGASIYLVRYRICEVEIPHAEELPYDPYHLVHLGILESIAFERSRLGLEEPVAEVDRRLYNVNRYPTTQSHPVTTSLILSIKMDALFEKNFKDAKYFTETEARLNAHLGSPIAPPHSPLQDVPREQNAGQD